MDLDSKIEVTIGPYEVTPNLSILLNLTFSIFRFMRTLLQLKRLRLSLL